MSKEDEGPKIIVDSDWKEEAAKEKEQLDEQTKETGHARGMPEPSLTEIVNLLMMQAVVGLGGMKSPTGESFGPDLTAAKHFIDLLGVLQDKTKGNLTDEEKNALDAVVYEMRMRYVEATSAPPPKPPEK